MNAARFGVIYLVGNLLSAGVPFLLLPLLTRVLEPAEYGAIVSFFILIAVFTPFSGLSVHGALGVAWFQKPSDDLPRFIGAAVVIASVTTLLLAALVVVAALLFDTRVLGLHPAVAALAAIVAGGNVLLQCRLVLWQSQNLPMANIALQVANSVLNIVLSLIGVLAFAWGAYGRIVGATTATVLIGICAVALLARAGLLLFEPVRADYRELVRFGGFLIPHGLAGALLTNADRLLVAALLGAAAVGTYGAAAQLGSVMAIVADAFVKAFNPWLFARLQLRAADQRLLVVGAIYAMVPLFVLIGFAMWIALLVAGQVMLGPRYDSAFGILPWFVLGGAFSGIYLAVSGLYFFEARTALLSVITTSTVVAGMLCTAGLLAKFGVAGAAAGYALVQGMLAFAAWFVARRVFELPWNRPIVALRAVWQRARASTRNA